MRFRWSRYLAAFFAVVCLCAYGQTIRMLVQSSPLAGFTHYDAADSFDQIKAGDELVLIREPDNPYDVNAVRVEWHGRKLGYLPRHENRAIAVELDRGGKIEARVAALRRHPDPRKRLLIDVFAVL